ncbi:MAG: hypothetical protein NTW66_03225 [Candidatus Magasanikbacteria bacterium]|nr:hypothetical protein [Candidatus Magasanikbacteria bacterium]
MLYLILQRLFFEALLDALYFPFWWYTGGVKHAMFWCADMFQVGNKNLSPGLWLKNIFVPMFGQYDIQGRIISFLMRFFQVLGRGFALLIWLIFCLALFIVWLAIPAVIVWGLVGSFLPAAKI